MMLSLATAAAGQPLPSSPPPPSSSATPQKHSSIAKEVSVAAAKQKPQWSKVNFCFEHFRFSALLPTIAPALRSCGCQPVRLLGFIKETAKNTDCNQPAAEFSREQVNRLQKKVNKHYPLNKCKRDKSWAEKVNKTKHGRETGFFYCGKADRHKGWPFGTVCVSPFNVCSLLQDWSVQWWAHSAALVSFTVTHCQQTRALSQPGANWSPQHSHVFSLFPFPDRWSEGKTTLLWLVQHSTPSPHKQTDRQTWAHFHTCSPLSFSLRTLLLSTIILTIFLFFSPHFFSFSKQLVHLLTFFTFMSQTN